MLEVSALDQPLRAHPGADGHRPEGGGRRTGGAGRRQRRRQDDAAARAFRRAAGTPEKSLFDGKDITRRSPDRRVRLGIVQVPEGRQVFGPLSVEDNLRLGAYTRTRAESDAELERVYAMFPVLKERRRQAAGVLSGGQQQMLAMGRGLMAKPRLLLLDEPTMGLAPRLVEEIFANVRALKQARTTIFLVDQNARAALSVADRGYVLETGRVVLAGTGPELLADEQVREAYLGM